MLALALVGLLCWQDPAPAPSSGSDSSQQADSSSSKEALRTWGDREAREKLKAFERVAFKKKASMADRKRALDELVGGKSERLVKPLQKFIEKDSSIVLKRKAVEMLAVQPQKRAHAAILDLLDNARVSANPQVQAGLVRALGKAGYGAKDWDHIKDLFESDYDTERVPVHEAILDLVAEHKERQAIPLLLRNFDEPGPSSVDAPGNPPAEYWKARWHSWAAWREKVRQTMRALTGQEFASASEAEAWLGKNPLPSKPGGKAKKNNKKKRRRRRR